MAGFDLGSAQPVDQGPPKKPGFDLASAQPVTSTTDQSSKSTPGSRAKEALGWAAAGPETAAHLITGAAAMPIAALTSLGDLAFEPEGQKVKTAAHDSEAVERAMTYEPRTKQGQEEAGALGKVLGLPAEVGDAAERAVQKHLEGKGIPKTAMAAEVTADFVPQALAAVVGMKAGGAAAEAGRLGPAEAATAAQNFAAKAGIDWASLPDQMQTQLTKVARDPKQLARLDPQAVTRAARGMKLGLPMTRGDITRNVSDIASEERMSKQEAKNPVRDIKSVQDTRLHELVDEVRKDTGAQATTRQAVGKSVQDKALRGKEAASQLNYDKLYDTARKTEPEAAVSPAPLYEYLKKNPEVQHLKWMESWLGRAKIMHEEKPGVVQETSVAKALADRGKASESKTVMRNIKLNELDDLRKRAVKVAREGGTDSHYAGEVLKSIDEMYDKVPQAATAWRGAIKAFREHQEEFKDQGLVRSLSSAKAGAKGDRAAGLSKTVGKVLKSDAEQIEKLHQTLTSGGTPRTRAAGEQAWRDLQGGVLEYLRSKAAGKRGIAGEKGQAEFNSPFRDAFAELDADGKIDALFTPAQAAKLREIYKAVGDTRTKPSSRISGSPTAANLAAISKLEHLSLVPGVGPAIAGAAKVVGKVGRLGTELRAGARAKSSPISEAAKRSNTLRLPRRTTAMTPFVLQDQDKSQ